MNRAKSKGRRGRGMPPEAMDHLKRKLLSLEDDDLEGEVRGRFCYVTHRETPRCRLGYQGELDQWEFAIYRYSRGSYGDLPLAPTRGKAADLVDLALRAYNLR